MNDELPPDQPDRWPRDPYRLLGVDFRVDVRQLKRTYTRLIRKFKPEHFPEQFRRIRDAYETILQRIETFGPVANTGAPENHLPTPLPPDEEPFGESRNAASSTDGGIPAPFRRLESLGERLEAIWSLACGGEMAAAYRQAVELERERPGEQAVCERLYWLLKIKPELDLRRTRFDWLAAGLRGGWRGSLAALYSRELAADSSEAAGERCARLLRTESRPEKQLELAQRRWQALEPDDALAAAVADDLASLQSRRRLGDDLAWAQVLLAALENLAWTEHGVALPLWQEVRDEVLSMHHLELRLDNELHQLDVLQELAEAWHALRMRRNCPRLLKVVRLSWNRSIWQIEADLDALIDELNGDRQQSLELLEAADQHARIVVVRLAALLSKAAEIREAEVEVHSIDTAATLVMDHLLDANSFQSLEFLPFDYANWRRELSPFMFEAVVSPWQFAEALESQRYFDLIRVKDLARELANDLPLRCLWIADRLFWA